MNGKIVKVKENGVGFGTKDRNVNLISCFKYIPNGNIYLIYSDVSDKYDIIYYGSCHIKKEEALCMPCRNKDEENIIKEYLFKLVGDKELDNVIEINIEEVESIEIISSSKLDIKPDILKVILEKKIPKKEEETISSDNKSKKKKGISIKVILMLLVIILICGGVYIVFNQSDKSAITRIITCNKKYNHSELNAVVNETNTYSFNVEEELKVVDTTMIYKFKKEDYDEFILKGVFYKYMPDDNTLISYNNDKENYKFEVVTKINIDNSYDLPTNYEDVLSYYESDGFKCDEEVVK